VEVAVVSTFLVLPQVLVEQVVQVSLSLKKLQVLAQDQEYGI
jgi:hypothetical protein